MQSVIDTRGVTVTQRTKAGETTTLTKASRQWATRPADERFDSLQALVAATRDYRKASRTANVKVGALDVVANGECLEICSPNGNRATPTHWAFGQLAARAEAPAAYLRTLPAFVAADCLRFGLAKRGGADAASKLLLRQDGDEFALHAITSDKYRRVWNHEIAESLLGLQAVNPSWVFPTAFKRAGGASVTNAWGESKELPVAFASDRDMFAFLVDYDHGVKVDGQDHALARGFFVENSEVGDAALKVTMFLFDFVCANVLVWGATNVTEVSMRHVGSVRERFLGAGSGVLAALRTFSTTSARETEAQIRTAQRTLVADNLKDVVPTLYKRRINGLTQAAITEAVKVVEENPRYGDPRSVWGIVNGLTEVSQRADHTDARIALDRAAGEVMNIVF